MTLKIRHGNGAAIVVSGFFFTKTAERDRDPYKAKGGRKLSNTIKERCVRHYEKSQ